MNLDQIETKCFILALFIRDDDERFLLGSGAYEFVDSQLHFAANTFQNDIVEVQGNDGMMLAGQVRRATSQAFDGYIGDSSVDRSTIEQYRKDFLKFFRKNHYYKVVYIFADGTAIQRRSGFIVEAPEVKELYQLFPKYHVSLNFEDVNYYAYEENSSGQEIYGESVTLASAQSANGGLIWENGEATTITRQGTNLTIQNTIADKFNSIQLDGNTAQQTYSGKNLFSKDTITTGYLVERTTGNIVANASYGASDFIPVTAGQQYTFSTGCFNYWYTAIYDSNKQFIGYPDNAATITIPASGAYIRTTVYLTKLDIAQFEQGSTTTSYEPYVGGAASPNPDYPQTVNTVTGRQMVEVYDKNLFSKDNANTLNAYISSASPHDILADSASVCVYIKCEQNTTYTISRTAGNVFRAVTTKIIPAAGVTTYDYVANDSGAYITLTTSAGAEYLLIEIRNFSSSQTLEDILASIQIEKGSTSTSYQTHQSYEVNLGKNLFNISDFVMGGMSNGALTTSNSRITNIVTPLKVDPNTTYTFSAVLGDTVKGIRVGIHQLDKNKNFLLDSNWQQLASSSYTFTTSSDTAYIGVVFSLSTTSSTVTTGGTENNTYYSNPSDWLRGCTPQIEKGSTATSYAPYFTPIELCKIGTYQDYIYKSGSDWYLHKETGKVVLDGSGTWYRQTTRDGVNYRFSVIVSDIKQGVTGVVGYSDKLIPVTTDTYSQDGISGTSSAQRISIRYDSIFGQTSASSFKTWLGDNNVTLYYALATPTDTQITNADLIAQLNALGNSTTYDRITLINVAGELQAILDLSLNGYDGGGVVWDSYGAEWEAGTSGGPTTISVDSIDNVYPVWELTGPATNPQLSDLTTNTTLTYNGTVTSSQTLKIDMFNKTALLNGSSVIGNILGDWVYLASGTNRITYTTGNNDAPDSTLWWQEIVG